MKRETLHRARRELSRAALAALLALPLLAIAASGASGPATVAVGGRGPALPPARELGTVATHKRLELTVVLAPRDPAALAAFASAVSTPGSPSYRHYVSVHQFEARFGSTAASIAAVRATLASDGLSVGRPATDGLSVPVGGSAAAVSRAFHVSLHSFRGRSGLRFYANVGEPRVPARLRGIVSDVLGLNDLPAATPEGLVAIRDKSQPSVARTAASSPFAGGLGPTPCPAATAFAATTDGEHTIDQIAQAYRINGLYADDDFGQGTTIALYEIEGYPSEATDIPTYESCFGTSGITPAITYVESSGGPGAYTPTAETSVDIENIIGIAPMAKVIVYQGPNDYPGTYDTLMQIVDANSAQVINDSWGECEADAGNMPSDENTLLEQADTQGQTFVTSSGDRGSEGCVPPGCTTGADSSCATWSPSNPGPLEVDDPASQPYATGVGATELTTPGPPPSETVWSQLFWGASGGGLSTSWAMPKYQANSGVPGVINSYSSGTPCQQTSDDCREVPDVSVDGAPEQGYVIFWNGVWWAAGGTSTGAPVWAALIALADASKLPGCTGTPLGFVNPLLYEVAAGVWHADAFNAITSGDNNPAATGPYPAGAGYNLATGLGTPIATDGSSPGLVQQLCDAASIGIGAAPKITSISAPAAGASHEAAVGSTVKIIGSNFTPFSAVWFGPYYATNVTYVNAGELDATVPAGSGSVYVTVEKQSGESVNSALDSFTFAPTETISSPASGAVYTQGQPLTASYSCAASTAGTPTCKGSLPAGSTVATSAVGQYSFTVSATDANGFTTTTTSSYTVVPPPSIAIASPAPGATYSLGEVVAASFSCSTAAGVTIASCDAPVMNGAPIDTQTLGSHSFTVSATDSNGISSSQTATYQVVVAPQALISGPANGQSFVQGAAITPVFACAVASPARITTCTATTTASGKLDTATIGVHTFTATATSSNGAAASTSVSYTVVAVRPRISDLRQAVSQWIERGAHHGTVHVGTKFSFTLDQPAKVTMTFTRAARGAISARGRCVAVSRAAAGARRCTRALAAGTLSVRGQRAANSFAFSGKTSSGTLGPGHYTVTLTARGLGGKPSPAVSLHFTIVSA